MSVSDQYSEETGSVLSLSRKVQLEVAAKSALPESAYRLGYFTV